MVIAHSYFYKDNKYKTWKSSVMKAILEISQTYKLHCILYWHLHWINVRDTKVYGGKPKWIWKIKINFENLKSKFKNWYKIKIQA